MTRSGLRTSRAALGRSLYGQERSARFCRYVDRTSLGDVGHSRNAGRSTKLALGFTGNPENASVQALQVVDCGVSVRMNTLPVLSTVPRSGTWFLRYTVSFLCHLEQGGRIDDRLTGRVVGDPAGPPFDFQRFKGGPLFRVRGSLPVDHLFVGHTVCPGFAYGTADFDWWKRTPFHVPGYDYLHEYTDYQCISVELAPYAHAPIDVPTMERSAWEGRGQRIAFVYRNPLDQATSFFRYCQHHNNPAYNSSRGRPLTSTPLHEYLFESALPSYAKQFISFQVMAAKHPELVQLVPYERLMAKPVDIMIAMLNHLVGTPRDWPTLRDAVWLARSEHMKAVENELGRSLDGTRIGQHSHMWQGNTRAFADRADGAMRNTAIAVLRAMGVDVDLFEWPAPSEATAEKASASK
jgi:hypothetical protein